MWVIGNFDATKRYTMLAQNLRGEIS
jgi:hypothetical protein